ncbi:MAG: hypothetical protein EBR49_17195, partial [Betaproteobacteria bacterium]|nr:hypothetical protein [Betaproteobacteria bacterium]
MGCRSFRIHLCVADCVVVAIAIAWTTVAAFIAVATLLAAFASLWCGYGVGLQADFSAYGFGLLAIHALLTGRIV